MEIRFQPSHRSIWSQKRHSRVLVGLVSSDIRAVDLLSENSDDADEQNEVYLRRNEDKVSLRT